MDDYCLGIFVIDVPFYVPYVVLGVVVVSVIIGLVIFDRLTRHHPDRHKAYGNWTQAVTAAAAVVFGVSSALVSVSIFQLQRSVRADAALDRAVQTFQFADEQKFRDRNNLETGDPTASDRVFFCVIYLKHRLMWTPIWTSRLLNPPFILDPLVMGREPDTSEAGKHYADLSHDFKQCVGGGNDIELRGIKIIRLIYLYPNFVERSLLEWPKFRGNDDSELHEARSLFVSMFTPDLCGFEGDVVGLFRMLDQVAQDGNNAAQNFAKKFLDEYPNLSDFIRRECPRTNP
jgi:hypothetical protein